ncbi:hypothetical protein EMCRGX_G010922 [Ephydatia muelleri]
MRREHSTYNIPHLVRVSMQATCTHPAMTSEIKEDDTWPVATIPISQSSSCADFSIRASDRPKLEHWDIAKEQPGLIWSYNIFSLFTAITAITIYFNQGRL